jgi:hypothetical protein
MIFANIFLSTLTQYTVPIMRVDILYCITERKAALSEKTEYLDCTENSKKYSKK